MYRCLNAQTQAVVDTSIGGGLLLVVLFSNAMGAHGEASRDRPLNAITSGYRASEELAVTQVW